jgi:hypothetical protein
MNEPTTIEYGYGMSEQSCILNFNTSPPDNVDDDSNNRLTKLGPNGSITALDIPSKNLAIPCIHDFLLFHDVVDVDIVVVGMGFVILLTINRIR